MAGGGGGLCRRPPMTMMMTMESGDCMTKVLDCVARAVGSILPPVTK